MITSLSGLKAPQLPNWSTDAHGVIRVTLDDAFGKPMPDDTYERVVLEFSPDAVAAYPILARMAAAEAFCWWSKRYYLGDGAASEIAEHWKVVLEALLT